MDFASDVRMLAHHPIESARQCATPVLDSRRCEVLHTLHLADQPFGPLIVKRASRAGGDARQNGVEQLAARALALYLTRGGSQRHRTLFADETDGALVAMADAVIDLTKFRNKPKTFPKLTTRRRIA